MRPRRVALVTGAAKRLGLEISKRLADDGFEVVLHYRSSHDQALTARNLLLAMGAPEVHLISADLSQAGESERLLMETEKSVGQLDLLVCNAATFEYDHALSATSSSLAQHVQTNFLSPVELVTRWAQIRALNAKNEAAHAVVLLDQKLSNLNPDYYSYTVSKLALGACIRFLAQSCSPWLRVNAVSPGVTLTSGDMTSSEFHAATRVAALGMSSTPRDIANAVWSLNEMSAVTGQTLIVDGGQHLVPRRRDVAFDEGEVL